MEDDSTVEPVGSNARQLRCLQLLLYNRFMLQMVPVAVNTASPTYTKYTVCSWYRLSSRRRSSHPDVVLKLYSLDTAIF